MTEQDKAKLVYDAVLDSATSPAARAHWLRLVLDEIDKYKTNMLLRDWLRGVIQALEETEQAK